jgi:hypothetical protein
MPATEQIALVAAFVLGLLVMLAAPFFPAPPKAQETFYWPALCGVETTHAPFHQRIELARQLASRDDLRAAAIRQAALYEEVDEAIRAELTKGAPRIAEA